MRNENRFDKKHKQGPKTKYRQSEISFQNFSFVHEHTVDYKKSDQTESLSNNLHVRRCKLVHDSARKDKNATPFD